MAHVIEVMDSLSHIVLAVMLCYFLAHSAIAVDNIGMGLHRAVLVVLVRVLLCGYTTVQIDRYATRGTYFGTQ